MTKTATVHAQQRWEYIELTRKTETYLLNDLNKVGQDGWELVSVAHGKDRQGELTWTAFLKRPYVAHGVAGEHRIEATASRAPQPQRPIEPPETSAASLAEGDELRFMDE